MDPNTFPTKGNLILAKNSLALSKQGYELMDKKRNILIREMMELIDQAKDIQSQIDETFRTAYAALQKANMEIGIRFRRPDLSYRSCGRFHPNQTRSVMGTEIPLVEYDKKAGNTPTYAYYSTKLSLDEAKAAFERVKELSIQLSMIEKRRHPSCHQHQKNPEACQCAEKHHHPQIRNSHPRYHQCSGRKRA
mgnify:CR=1 FL=1